MTEPTTKSVDLGDASSPFASILGGALHVNIRLENGRIAADSLRAMGAAIEGRLRERGAPEDLVEKIGAQLADMLERPGRQDEILANSLRRKRASVEGALAMAAKLLDDVPDTIKEIAVLDIERKGGHFAYQLGMASGAVLTCMNEIGAAREAVTHALDCDCGAVMPHGEPAATTAPTTPEASPDAP